MQIFHFSYDLINIIIMSSRYIYAYYIYNIHQQALLIKGYLRWQIFAYFALFALPVISPYHAINLRRTISIWYHTHAQITQRYLKLRQ